MVSMADLPEQTVAVIERLKSLGLTKYEALVYIALLKVTDATATEIHEISGVPRASVYPVLSQLQEKELAFISQSSPRRFAALPPEEAIKSLLSRIEDEANSARDSLVAIYTQREAADRSSQELIWNLHGSATIRRKLADLIGQAESRIRIMAHSTLFSEDIRQALTEKSRQIPVEIYTHEWDCPVPPSLNVMVKKPPKAFYDIRKARTMMAGGICIIDEKKIYVVIGSGDEDAVALYSEADGFVRFFSRYYALIRDVTKKTDQ